MVSTCSASSPSARSSTPSSRRFVPRSPALADRARPTAGDLRRRRRAPGGRTPQRVQRLCSGGRHRPPRPHRRGLGRLPRLPLEQGTPGVAPQAAQARGRGSSRSGRSPRRVNPGGLRRRRDDRGGELEGGGGQLHRWPEAQHFYRSLARRSAERGWLRLHLLYLDGRPVAYFYGVAYRNQLYGLKTSDDVAFAKRLGVVVVLHALQAAFEEGVSVIDFLGFYYVGRWRPPPAPASIFTPASSPPPTSCVTRAASLGDRSNPSWRQTPPR